jgi:hypothetical protein
MATATGLVITKRMPYRGDPNEEWSNKYWLTGQPPGTAADWRILFDKIVVEEKAVYTNRCHVIGGYGYNDDTPGANSVWSVDLTATSEEVPGTLTATQANPYAGDQAGVVEWKTDEKNTRGKWIYLRKYFHGGISLYTDTDKVSVEGLAAYNAFALVMRTGTPATDGRFLRSQRKTMNIQDGYGLEYVTTRTLKRRGKRP